MPINAYHLMTGKSAPVHPVQPARLNMMAQGVARVGIRVGLEGGTIEDSVECVLAHVFILEGKTLARGVGADLLGI